ncbi:MAG TPA: OmpA family protein [Nitrospiraceae bacterium]|nr:OmpA family protein [Nitrospiraceae bacterium]
MKTRYWSAATMLLVCGLTGIFSGTAASQDAESVKLGEEALRFASGSILETMPQDGIVNLVTGDNQTTGNRMILGWRGSDTLYLKLHHPGDASLGDLYTVYRRVRKVFHPANKRYLGYVINRLAVVRVLQIDHSLATVQVVRSFAPVSPGDPVMRFVAPSQDVGGADVQSPIEGDGMIVDMQADKNMSLVGQWNVVYLDRGKEDGIRPGDRLEVHRLGGGLPRRKVAEIKILSTEEKTATALIVKSMSRVLIGDRVRYESHGEVHDPRSESGPGDTQQFVGAEAGPTPVPSVAVEKPNRQIRLVPGTEGMRIDLEELVEQLEYDSGEVKVKAPGLVILDKIAEFLRSTALDKPIRVEGHADNMEIGPSLKSVFPSNWELSRARAAGIVRHLVEKGGLDSAKLTAVGYGATRPVASNATEEGRKRNRRIEIVLLTTEPAGSAQESTKKPNLGTANDPMPAAGPSVSSVSTSTESAMDHNMPATPAPEGQPQADGDKHSASTVLQ